jgi:glycosyltransferase involved in cell wall biosynthesis
MLYPKVSVCVLAYNSGKTIERCIRSICNQNYAGDIEIIVHDDASSDGTLNILSDITIPEKISMLILKKRHNTYSKGYRAIWDDVLRRSSGQYICFCDADDYWCSENKLTLQVKYLEQHVELDLVGGITLFNDLTSNIEVLFPKINTKKLIDFIEAEQLFKMCQYVHTSSMMFRRTVLHVLPTSKIRYLTNGDLIIQCLASIRSGKIGIINKKMSVYESNQKGLYSGITKIQRDKNYIQTWSYLKSHPEVCSSKYSSIANIQFSFFHTKFNLRKLTLSRLKVCHLPKFSIGLFYRLVRILNHWKTNE